MSGAMHLVRLIHWNAAEAEERARRLEDAGYDVAFDVPQGGASLRKLVEGPPAAIVIDLSRLPAQGRDVALAIREFKDGRGITIVFVDGDSEKVARIKGLLPNATFTTWDGIRAALTRAIGGPPTNAARRTRFDAYASTPLPKKLGIKKGSVVALVGAPGDFESTLGELPEGVVLRRAADVECDLTLWFTTARVEVERRVSDMAAFAKKDGLWILWPKRSSGVTSDLTQAVVRGVAKSADLVDYKISAIDETWSGLRFTWATVDQVGRQAR